MDLDKCLLGRQPILDRKEQVCAYELLFRSSHLPSANVQDHSVASATVILNMLSGFGVQDILGGHFGYINVELDLLMSESLELLPPDLIGLELLESLEVTPALVERCKQLKAAGFTLSLDDHCYSPAFEPLYPLVDVVKIDLFQTPIESLGPILDKLRVYPCKLLAEKIETREVFQQCFDYGFDYFQGYYFAKPAVIEKQRIDGTATALLKLVQLLMSDAEIDEIEATMRMCPGLTYSLLLLVNSVAMGSRKTINSVRHAVAMIGRQQLKRWVQLALFASDDSRGLENPVVDMAAVRGGMMEQLVRNHDRLRKVADLSDQAFMVGILSLLEWIYSISMDEVVQALHLSTECSDALLHHQGILGELLACVEAMEQMDFKGGWPRLEALGFTYDQVLEAQCKAFQWKSKMG